jgi:hypothetical protein
MPSKKLAARKHIEYHTDGTVWGKGFKFGDTMTGYWEWFRKDGTKMRSGYFEGNEKVGTWTTYDKKGKVYKVTEMKPKARVAAHREKENA